MINRANNKPIFDKNSFNVKNFILITWYYKFLFVALSLLFAVITLVYFDNVKSNTFSVQYIIKKIDTNENQFFIGNFNSLSKKISAEFDYETSSFSPDYFFSLFTRFFSEGQISKQVIRDIKNLTDDNNLDDRIILSNEIRKMEINAKPLTATEQTLFKEGIYDLSYELSFVSKDLDYAEKVIKLLIKRLNVEGKNFIRDQLDSMNELIHTEYRIKLENSQDEIDNQKKLIDALIKKRIDHLQYQSSIAKELNYEFNQLIYLDEPPFINFNQKSISQNQDDTKNGNISSSVLFPTIGSYYDGYRALDQETAELKYLISNEKDYDKYLNNILADTLLATDKILVKRDQAITKINVLLKSLDQEDFSLVGYNSENLYYLLNKKNTTLALIISVIFSIFFSYFIIYIRYIFSSESSKS